MNCVFYRYMDGAFLELDAENVEAEVDEYTRDLYKIQKVFNSKIKKMQMEIDERNREKKKKRRHAEESGDAAPEDEDDALHIPQGANICSTVQDQMRDFKVCLLSIIQNCCVKKFALCGVFPKLFSFNEIFC